MPSHLYEFSFAPNPRWSRRYAPQHEIQLYLEDVARRHDVLGQIRTNTEVTAASWDAEAGKWTLQTSAGAHEADVLLTACGGRLFAPPRADEYKATLKIHKGDELVSQVATKLSSGLSAAPIMDSRPGKTLLSFLGS